jgi:hypothetical protein
VMEELKFEETHLFPFIQKTLGDQAVADLKKAQQEVLKPIPQDAPFKQKYETAFSNWVLFGGVTFNLLEVSSERKE